MNKRRLLTIAAMLIMMAGLCLSLPIVLVSSILDLFPSTEDILPPPLQLVGEIGGNIDAWDIDGDYAFVSMQNKFRVIDLRDPMQPILLDAAIDLPDKVSDLVVNGRYAFVAMTNDGIRAIDIHLPENPELVGEFTPALTDFDILAAHDNYLLAAELYGADMWILDVSDPANMVEVARFQKNKWPDNAQVSGISAIDSHNDAIYIIHGRSITVLDGTSLPDGNILDSHTLEATINSIAWTNDRFYALIGGSSIVPEQIEVFAINNDHTLTRLGMVDQFQHLPRAIAAQNEGVYATTAEGVVMFESINEAPFLTELWFQPLNSARDVIEIKTNDNMLYAWSEGSNGHIEQLDVIDITIPEQPHVQGQLATGLSVFDLILVDETIYLSDGKIKLSSIDVSDKTAPTLEGTLPLANGYSLSWHGSMLYVGTEEGVTAVTIADPAHLQILDSYPHNDGVSQVAVIGDGRYVVAATESELLVLDVADPQNLQLNDRYPFTDLIGLTPDTKRPSLVASAEHIYLQINDTSLVVLAIDAAAIPQQISAYPTDTRYEELVIRNNLLFAAAAALNKNEVEVIDISDPTDLQQILTQERIPKILANDIGVNDQYIYVGGSSFGSSYLHTFNYDDSVPLRSWRMRTIESERTMHNLIADNTAVYVVGNGSLMIWQQK